MPLAQAADAHQARSGSRLRDTRLARDRTGRPSGSHPLAAAKHRLQCRNAGASHGNADLDHAPQVDQNALFERVLGLGVAVNGVETYYAADCSKGTSPKDEEKGDLLSTWALNGPQRRNGKSQDPYIGYDVERRCCCMRSGWSVRGLSSALMGNRRVQTIEESCGVDAGARLSLADEEEHGVQDDRCLAEDLECPR